MLQLAHDFAPPELLLTGFELCGSYRFPVGGAPTAYGRPACMTPESLRRAMDGREGMHGIKRVRVALRYLLPGSGSPMETVLVLVLILPPRLGGYGFPAPELNLRCYIDTCGMTYYIPDPGGGIETLYSSTLVGATTRSCTTWCPTIYVGTTFSTMGSGSWSPYTSILPRARAWTTLPRSCLTSLDWAISTCLARHGSVVASCEQGFCAGREACRSRGEARMGCGLGALQLRVRTCGGGPLL